MSKLSYSYQEAADETGYGVSVIREQVRLGNITARFANTKPVIMHKDLEAWLESLPTESPRG